jgi:glycosyltransferase involved in cell wall biosynthesis
MVKIGIDYTSAIQQSAGIGRYTRELIKALATPVMRNGSIAPRQDLMARHQGVARHLWMAQYRLFVAASKPGLMPPLPGPNFAWCSTRLTERWLARLWYRLRIPLPIECWTGPLDLFHAPDFVLPPVKSNTPTIVTIHDLSFVRLPEMTMPGMSDHLSQWVPYSVNRATHVIAVSEATRQDLIELYQTPPEKITVLYHGVSSEFRPINEASRLAAIRQKYKLGTQPYILSVGTIQPRKNYRRLIQAFARLKLDVSLVIAGGQGWSYETVYDEAQKQGVAERVYFPGFVAEADLPALYSAASLFVYPSLYEGFGLPILEAMACGVPVIASNQSSLPEVVGSDGLLVDPYDVEAMAEAMARLLEEPRLSQRLSEAGQARAAQFTWSDTATKLINLYEKIIEE